MSAEILPFPLRRNLALVNRFVDEYRALQLEHGQAKANEYEKRFQRRQFNRLKRLGIPLERIRDEMLWFTFAALDELRRRAAMDVAAM